MDKQKEILSAALRLFVEFGFHGTPTSTIAKQAGVANGTLFHYYKTKDELILALYTDVKEKMSQNLKSKIENEENPEAILKLLIINSFYWALDNRAEFRFVQLFQASPYQAMISQEVLDKQMQPYVALIETAMKAKILRQVSVDLVCLLLISHISGVFQYLVTKEFSEKEQKNIIEDAYSMLWNMIT